MLLIASGLIFGQIVEKYSSSFAFPLTLTSVNGMRSAADQPSFFRTVHCFAQKGIVTFYYGVPSNASQGYIAMYLVSGELVKKFMLLKSHGSVQCDLSHAPAGLYLASISCGTYRHTLKLALSR
jgi:hypothetical protein